MRIEKEYILRYTKQLNSKPKERDLKAIKTDGGNLWVSLYNVNSFCSISLASVFLETSERTDLDFNNFPVYQIFLHEI